MSLSTLNWKRGLLRLWAVAAVLWVGVAFSVTSPIDSVKRVILIDDWRPVLQFDPLHPGTFSSPVSNSGLDVPGKTSRDTNPFDKLDPINVVMPDGTVISGVPGGTTKAEMAAKFPSHIGSRKYPGTLYNIQLAFEAVSSFAKLAFIPPLLLLALGYIGLWVGRGFKMRDADEK